MEGIAFPHLRAHSTSFEALSRLPHLRILIIDGVKVDSVLSGFHLPRLAMFSWRYARGPALPCALKPFKSAAVLDISGSAALVRLPDSFKACLPLLTL